jgi:hypothetical protein
MKYAFRIFLILVFSVVFWNILVERYQGHLWILSMRWHESPQTARISATVVVGIALTLAGINFWIRRKK